MEQSKTARENIETALERVFREVLNDPSLDLHDGLSPESCPEWDSLAHISLMFSIESEFGIRFTEEEMAAMATAGTIREVVLQRTAAI